MLDQAAPDFSLPATGGQTLSLSALHGRKVVLYFYPAAMTPGCTTQAVDFTASRDDFLEAGMDVVGISPDAPDKLAKFRERKHLNVQLLADPSLEFDVDRRASCLWSVKGQIRVRRGHALGDERGPSFEGLSVAQGPEPEGWLVDKG